VTTTPAAGDLVELAHDGRRLSLALVASAHDGFVLVWPVSSPGAPVSPPAVRVGGGLFGPVFAWPSRETGVDAGLVSRVLGRLLSPTLVAEVADAIDDGATPPLQFAPAPPPHLADAALAYSVAMVEAWARVGDLVPSGAPR